MAPLDTGSVTHTLRLVDPIAKRAEPVSADFQTIGAYLKAVREFHGKSLAALANETRIRKLYLSAIEDGDLSPLPSRPFSIGYVRAYAQALGLDGDRAAARFKAEAPDTSEPLRAPSGVQHQQVKRSPFIFAALLVVGLAVVTWNITQHAVTVAPRDHLTGAPAAAANAAPAPAPTGPIALGAAQPAPADQTTPVPYITPGLAAAAPEAAETAPAPKTGVLLAAVQPGPAAPPKVFEQKGAIYGAPPTGPTVLLQAGKAGSLIVRGASGAVYFARQLAPGEAYRAPLGQGLTVETSHPAAFHLYVGGQLKGSLVANSTPLDKASPPPAPPAAPVAAPAPALAGTPPPQ